MKGKRIAFFAVANMFIILLAGCSVIMHEPMSVPTLYHKTFISAHMAEAFHDSSCQIDKTSSITSSITGIAAEDEWPMAAANPQRTSWTPEEVRGALNPIWYKTIEPYISPRVQIIAANGLLYISTAKGLYALDAETGDEAWVYPTELPLGHSPTIDDNVAYVGGFDKKIHAIDALTGQGLWTFDEAEAGFQTNPLVVNDFVYMGNRDGYMYAISAHDTPNQGQRIWSYKTQGPILFSAAYQDGAIYFASNDSHAYALDAQTGDLIWKSAKLPGAGFHSWWPVVYQDPESGADVVIFAGSQNYRTSLSPGPTGYIGAYDRNDVYPDHETDPRGTLVGLRDQDGWIDATRITQYFEDNPNPPLSDPDRDRLYKPWRRTYFVLDRITGDEFAFDSDDDGNPEYAPILWFGTHSGNRYPPVIGSDGILYQANNFMSDLHYRTLSARAGIWNATRMGKCSLRKCSSRSRPS